MPEPAEPPDAANPCFSCGRCCYGPRHYVQLFDEDLARLGPELQARLAAPGREQGRLYMRMQDGHCAALDVSGGLFRCSIYAQRPLICRIYELYGASSACPPKPGSAPTPPNASRQRPRP